MTNPNPERTVGYVLGAILTAAILGFGAFVAFGGQHKSAPTTPRQQQIIAMVKTSAPGAVTITLAGGKVWAPADQVTNQPTPSNETVEFPRTFYLTGQDGSLTITVTVPALKKGEAKAECWFERPGQGDLRIYPNSGHAKHGGQPATATCTYRIKADATNRGRPAQ